MITCSKCGNKTNIIYIVTNSDRLIRVCQECAIKDYVKTGKDRVVVVGEKRKEMS